MLVIEALQRVFKQPRYVLGALFLSFSMFSVTVLLPSFSLIKQIVGSQVSVIAKLSFVFGLYGSLLSSYTWWGSLNIVLLAVLFGINIALLTYYIRRRQEHQPNVRIHLASIGGLVSGLFGIGCAACGSVIVTGILGLFGASGLLLLLPFHGAEFGVLGLALFLGSIYYLSKRIKDPLVCPLNTKDQR